MPPPECLVPYIRDAGFEGLLEMSAFDYDMSLLSALDVAYQLGLRTDGDPISGCVRDFDQSCGVGTWQMAQDFLADVLRRARGRIMLGENDLVEAASPIDPAGRRIPGCVKAICALLHYDDDWRSLVLDKTNNIVFLRWVPLLRDFESCSKLSWGSVVLCWIYQRLCIASRRYNLEISGCLPRVFSWIY
ncbi:hypothetical protein PIB30_089487 [Stylosanthes scabra]|uniref:Aminotransferase-like plant mobile domain-containing protein n=1 Tax=Stylosanthes scabra TaxID=79078 RepID=A0ABU6ZSN2_9FABA|nr:hypothetical protein [Stylosanthes scabra]